MMNVDLGTLPARCCQLGREYREAVRMTARICDGIETLDGTYSGEFIACLAGEAHQISSELTRLIDDWLDGPGGGMVDMIAAAAPRVIPLAVLVHVPRAEARNRAYLVLRAYCEDGGTMDWLTWLTFGGRVTV
jgi:hypothetical protein